MSNTLAQAGLPGYSNVARITRQHPITGDMRGDKMLIERIVLGDVKDTCNRVYHTWIDVTKDRPVIVFHSERCGEKFCYHIESIFLVVLHEEESLFIDFGEIKEIQLSEIKRLCKQVLSAIPGSIGTLETKVELVPCDPIVPF